MQNISHEHPECLHRPPALPQSQDHNKEETIVPLRPLVSKNLMRSGHRIGFPIWLSFLLLALLPSCEAQPGPNGAALTGEIAGLEAKFGMPPGLGRPIMQRLLDMELRVFGVEQYGPIVPRIQRLNQTAPGNLLPLPNKPQAQPGGEPQRSYLPPVQGNPIQLPADTQHSMIPAPADPVSPFPPNQTPVPRSQTAVQPSSNAATVTVETPHSEEQQNLLSGEAFKLANAFPLSLVRIPAAHPEFAAIPDYYNEVRKASKNKGIRFKTMPIPVYIQPFPDRDFVNCVIRAFESWEQRTGGAVRFQQVDNSETARIRVYWKHLGVKSDDKGCVLGAHTILKYTDRGSGNLSFVGVGAVPVPVYIPRFGPKYTVPPQVMEINLDLISTKDYSIKYRCLQNIVTHELGHALGLLGHSPCPADIMYPVTDEHSRLSQRDLNTLIKLYETKVDIPL